MVAFASTSGMFRSSPSRSRSRWCATGSNVDVDVVAAELDRETAQVIRPLVERAAGAEIEAGVVPVTREDAVGDRSAVEREAHVRTTVVDRVDSVAVREEADRVALDVDDEPAGGAQVGERRRAHERVGGNGAHRVLRGGIAAKARTSSNVDVKWRRRT
jgi:hypothetical protein